MLLILNIPLIGLWIRLLKIPYRFLYPAIICLICIGVYTVRGTTFDVFLVVGFGYLGYILRLLKFELAPLLVGFILGPMIEENLRRAAVIYRGDFVEFLVRPISGTLLAMTFGLLLWTAWTVVRNFRNGRKEAYNSSDTD